MFTNAKDAIYYIENIKRNGRRENLSRMEYALKLLGNPEKSFSSVHIAGTNGKGSTVAYLSCLLQELGYKVGSFVSPYVVKFNERIEINNQYISDEDLIKYANKVKEVCDIIYQEKNDIVTFFEFLTLLGFLYFKEQGVDFALVEVGMGGILDATNVIDASIRIITNIGFDHMSVLGNTLEEIADKKLGIVHKDDILVSAVDVSLRPYFKEKMTGITDNIYFTDPENIKINWQETTFTFDGETYNTPLLGAFQAYNASLAIKAVKLLFNMDCNSINKALAKVKWAGRMQIVNDKPLTVIDGGHNIHGINALVSSLALLKGKRYVRTIFTALKDKETKKMIDKLSEITDEFIFTEIDDIRKKEAILLKEETLEKATVIADYKEAIRKCLALSKADDILVITGSLHFISEVIKFFDKQDK